MFSVTKNGKPLDPSLYIWDEKTKTFSTNENGLVLDFSDYNGVALKTGDNCTFTTGFDCTFKTGAKCTFKTFHGCTFDTGTHCTFKTGANCTFTTGYDCTFNTGYSCTFTTGYNCFVTRWDINGCTKIPEGKTIKINGFKVNGYTIIEDQNMKYEFVINSPFSDLYNISSRN